MHYYFANILKNNTIQAHNKLKLWISQLNLDFIITFLYKVGNFLDKIMNLIIKI